MRFHSGNEACAIRSPSDWLLADDFRAQVANTTETWKSFGYVKMTSG